MSKNIIINDTTYTGISDVQFNTTEGGTATFKDIDDIENVEYATPSISVNNNGTITASANGKSATHKLSTSDDADFIASNIALGKTIFGITGTLSQTVSGGGSENTGSTNSHIYETTLEGGELGFSSLNVEHNLGSKKLFWMIKREMPEGYVPVSGHMIYACGLTPGVWLPDAEIPSLNGEGNINIYDTYSPGVRIGYQRCSYSLNYNDTKDWGLNMGANSQVISSCYPVDTNTDNKLVANTSWDLSSTKGATFKVTIIDLSAGLALM